MPSKSKGKSNPPTTAPAAPIAVGASGRPAGGSAGPCKLTPLGGAGNAFQMPATSMPFSVNLLTPDSKTEFLSVSIFKHSDLTAPLPNSPTPSATSFTLNLPALTGDSYVVIMVVGSLPSAEPVWITEACSGATKLDWIATPVNTTGEFDLTVT